MSGDDNAPWHRWCRQFVGLKWHIDSGGLTMCGRRIDRQWIRRDDPPEDEAGMCARCDYLQSIAPPTEAELRRTYGRRLEWARRRKPCHCPKPAPETEGKDA